MTISCENGKSLSEAEQAVIDYINSHQDTISNSSISNIAENSFVSNATVSRAIRKCGFGSLGELKYRLTSSYSKESSNYTVNRTLAKSYQECVETLQRIDIKSVLDIVHMLWKARRVIVAANGLTALIAEEFSAYLQYQNINTWHTADTNVMKSIDQLITSEDLLVIVTVKNTMPVLETAASLAKKSGAKVVVLCAVKGTPLEKYSDVTLYCSSLQLGDHLVVDTMSRLGLMILTRTIIEYMYSDDV